MSSFITISFLLAARTKFLFSKLYIFVYVRRMTTTASGVPAPSKLDMSSKGDESYMLTSSKRTSKKVIEPLITNPVKKEK